MRYTMEALALPFTKEAEEEAAAETTKGDVAPTSLLFASRTVRMEMKLTTVTEMVVL